MNRGSTRCALCRVTRVSAPPLPTPASRRGGYCVCRSARWLQRRRDAVRFSGLRPDREGARDRVAADAAPSRSPAAQPGLRRRPRGPAARRRLGRCRPGLHAAAPYAADALRRHAGRRQPAPPIAVANAREYAPRRQPPIRPPAPTAMPAGPWTAARRRARRDHPGAAGRHAYGIAKRYGVSIAALIEVNGLAHGSTIKPGQQLVLPAGAIAAKPAPEQPRAAARRWRGRRPRRRRPPHRSRPPAGRDATR